ncbi:MAG: cation diffusion facilitator family transporter [Chloroflexi bacterium]|nr:cation diffusion facilitator family transporter [Chloroflexota bacterium]
MSAQHPEHDHRDHHHSQGGHGDHHHSPGDHAPHGHTHAGQRRHHTHGGSAAHRRQGFLGLLAAVLHLYSHGAGERVDAAAESNARGTWALKLSLVGLGATALFQLAVVLASGSVALLADTVHNFSDALTAVPLWIAFALSRRAPSRRYTYGYGRAEDLTGAFIILMIVLSAALAGWESIDRLLNPRPLTNLGWVMVAAMVGCLGNEAVASLRIRVGREIGSAALVADGYHARVDGLTSLAVLLGAVGSLVGFPLADPLVGLAITATILLVLKGAMVQMWGRLMDASDPRLVERFEREASAVDGVQAVEGLRVRWLGHRLEADLGVVVDGDLPTRDSHAVAEAVRHALFHAEPRLATVVVHVDPCGHAGVDAHTQTRHHAAEAMPRGAEAVYK